MCELRERIVTLLQLLVDGKVEEFLNSSQNNWNKPERIGLCTRMDEVVFCEATHLFESWEFFSGSNAYPVPSPEHSEESPKDYYNDPNLYIGHQLEMRQSLAQHIINNIQLLNIKE